LSQLGGWPTFNDLCVHHSHCVGNARKIKSLATHSNVTLQDFHIATVTSDLASHLQSAHHRQGGGGRGITHRTNGKSFKYKILPVSYCGTRIFWQIPPKVMIAIDQGEGGYPKKSLRAAIERLTLRSRFARSREFSRREIHNQEQSLRRQAPASGTLSRIERRIECGLLSRFGSRGPEGLLL